MASANLQQCDVCKTVNTDQKTKWVRLLGVVLASGVARPIPLDFCPDCAPKTTVDKVPTIATPEPPPATRPPQLPPVVQAS